MSESTEKHLEKIVIELRDRNTEYSIEVLELKKKLDCAVKALEEIGAQSINEEEYESKGGDDYENTDHREGYEWCVERARLALEEIKK